MFWRDDECEVELIKRKCNKSSMKFIKNMFREGLKKKDYDKNYV